MLRHHFLSIYFFPVPFSLQMKVPGRGLCTTSASNTTSEEPATPSAAANQPPTGRIQLVLEQGRVVRFIPISEPHCNHQSARREVPQIDPEIIYWLQPLHTIVEYLAPYLSQTFTHLLKLALYPYLIPPDFLFVITFCGADPHQKLHYY